MRREIWHLTEGLIFAHFAIFIVGFGKPEIADALGVVPGRVLAEPWRLVTFQFIHGGDIFWFFISMLVLGIMARPLEVEWGSARFLLFWLISVLGASTTSALLHIPLVGDVFLATSLLFTYATVYPDTEFYVFFIIRVKVKWLAMIGGGLLLLSSLSLGLATGAANAVGMSAGYLFFLATRKLPSRRKIAFEIAKKRARIEIKAESSITEQRNRAWDERVRAAEERSRASGTVSGEDEELLRELDAARDPAITVCAPQDFGYVNDGVCRSCTGYPECAARRIRMAAEEGAKNRKETDP
jgi:membrane associated rhomboid family serine protease